MKFYVCSICGNVIELIDGDSKRIRCCGKEMDLIEANTKEASFEKHIPFCEIIADKVKVTIGEDVHPMDESHYIMWIAAIKDNKITRVNLKPTESPEAIFDHIEGITILAYCNLHGLWKKQL